MSDAKYVAAGIEEMSRSDLMGGTLRFANQDFSCTVGTFSLQNVLDTGGFTPTLMGDVQLPTAGLPENFVINAGMEITVTPNTGKARQCQVHSVQAAGPYLNILLRDINEGA